MQNCILYNKFDVIVDFVFSKGIASSRAKDLIPREAEEVISRCSITYESKGYKE